VAQLVTKTLALQMRDVLRERILTGVMPPSGRVDQDSVAAEFDISTTPVRDALRLLERDGLVVIRPRRGVYAVPVNAKVFRDVFDARIALECLAVETAVQHIPEAAFVNLVALHAAAAETLTRTGDEEEALGPIDNMIHDLIIEHCNNDVVRELMESLRDRTDWVRRLAAKGTHSYKIAFAEHCQLLEALRARDVATAVTTLRDHLRCTRDQTLVALAAHDITPEGEALP